MASDKLLCMIAVKMTKSRLGNNNIRNLTPVYLSHGCVESIGQCPIMAAFPQHSLCFGDRESTHDIHPKHCYVPGVFGFSKAVSNALAMVGNFITLRVILFFAWLNDKTNQPGLTVMGPSRAI